MVTRYFSFPQLYSKQNGELFCTYDDAEEEKQVEKKKNQ